MVECASSAFAQADLRGDLAEFRLALGICLDIADGRFDAGVIFGKLD